MTIPHIHEKCSKIYQKSIKVLENLWKIIENLWKIRQQLLIHKLTTRLATTELDTLP
jgi:hypothetical protein